MAEKHDGAYMVEKIKPLLEAICVVFKTCFDVDLLKSLIDVDKVFDEYSEEEYWIAIFTFKSLKHLANAASVILDSRSKVLKTYINACENVFEEFSTPYEEGIEEDDDEEEDEEEEEESEKEISAPAKQMSKKSSEVFLNTIAKTVASAVREMITHTEYISIDDYCDDEPFSTAKKYRWSHIVAKKKKMDVDKQLREAIRVLAIAYVYACKFGTDKFTPEKKNEIKADIKKKIFSTDA